MPDSHKTIYIKNAIILAVLTVIEVYIAYLHISKIAQIVLLMSFATTKMLLVAMVYMHLKYETKFLKLVVFFPIPLALLFAMALIYDIPHRCVM